jgi:hypothetical protein
MALYPYSGRGSGGSTSKTLVKPNATPSFEDEVNSLALLVHHLSHLACSKGETLVTGDNTIKNDSSLSIQSEKMSRVVLNI